MKDFNDCFEPPIGAGKFPSPIFMWNLYAKTMLKKKESMETHKPVNAPYPEDDIWE